GGIVAAIRAARCALHDPVLHRFHSSLLPPRWAQGGQDSSRYGSVIPAPARIQLLRGDLAQAGCSHSNLSNVAGACRTRPGWLRGRRPSRTVGLTVSPPFLGL